MFSYLQQCFCFISTMLRLEGNLNPLFINALSLPNLSHCKTNETKKNPHTKHGQVACWHRLKILSRGPWVYFNGECASTQRLICGILGQSGLSIKFSTLMIREAKGPMLNADQIGPQCHPWRLQPVAWPFIICLEGLLMGEGFVTDWNVKWRTCVYTLTDAWMCECTYMRMCVEIMMSETIMNLQMNCLKLVGTKVKNMLCACVCLCYNKWVCGVGKRVIFKILTM